MSYSQVGPNSSVFAALPFSTFLELPHGVPDGTVAVVLDVDKLYIYDLGTDTWVVASGGGVAASRLINTTAPLTGGGDLSADRTLAITQSNGSQDGYLSSTDWSTFNNKVATTRTISTTSPLSGGGDLSANRTISISQSSGSTNGFLSSTDWNTFNNKQPAGSYEVTTNKGAASGYCPLDASSKVPASYLPSTVMEFKDIWNPNTNTPALVDGTGDAGDVYWVSAAKSSAVSGLTDPSMVNFQIGDLVIYSSVSGKWKLTTPAAGVSSVNSAQGAVTVNAINQLTGDVTAGPASGSQSQAATISANAVTNSKMAAMSANTVKANQTGSSANPSDTPLSTVTESTSSVLTLSNWSNATIGSVAPTIEVKKATASVDGYLAAADFTSFNSKVSSTRAINTTSPLTGGGDLSADRTLSIPAATTSVSGYLTSTDWNTFNNKEPAITSGTTSQYWRGDKSFQTLNVAALLAFTDGSSAASGKVNELIEGSTALATANVAASGSWGYAHTQSLTAGRWLVYGMAQISENGAVLTDSVAVGVSTSANPGSITFNYVMQMPYISSGGSDDVILVSPPRLLSLSATTSVYCNTKIGYSSGTPKHAGAIFAVRIG